MLKLTKNNLFRALFVFMMLFISLKTVSAMDLKEANNKHDVDNNMLVEMSPQILIPIERTTIEEDGSTTVKESEVTCEVLMTPKVKAFLNKILGYIKIFGPILVVVLASVDFLKATVSQDSDALKKASAKALKRLAAAALLFIFPLLIQMLLDVVKINGITYCKM
ncbi:MAG: hypothetical protein PHO63_00525 [Bacilli bacterium]|nr:hypothetical protein [Bacilli bacterium]MDD4809202.1 hypothetical protein [Bacilli bacterium]